MKQYKYNLFRNLKLDPVFDNFFPDLDSVLDKGDQSLAHRDYVLHHRKATVVLSAMLIIGVLLLLAVVVFTIFAAIYLGLHGPYGYGPFIIPIVFLLLFSIDFMAFLFVYSEFFRDDDDILDWF